MGYNYYINFKDKTEYVKHNNHFLTYPIGALLFAVIDRDWETLAQDIATARRNAFSLSQTQEAYAELEQMFSGCHVFLRRDFERLSKNGDVLYAAWQWATEYAKLKDVLTRLITEVLDVDGTHKELTVLQRYFLLNKTDGETRRFKQKMHEQLKVFQCMMCGEMPENVQVTPELAAGLSIEAAICYASDDLRTLVFMEFEYMVTENYGLRRCENCGKYFLPFSVVSRYCDRPAQDGKTCRDNAIRENYNRRLQENDAKALYVKNNNAYQMRVKRTPELYPPEEYRLWKQRVREALQQVERGELEEAAYREIAALPKKRSQLSGKA